MVRLSGRPRLRIMYSRMLNSLGASSITSLLRVTRRRMQSSTRSRTCNRSGMRLSATHQHAYARQQFHERERFGQVIVRALFQALHAIIHRAAGAQNQDGRAGLAVANLLQHGKAVDVRQPEIEHDQIVLGGMNHIKRRASVGPDINSVASAFESAPEKIGDSLFVFDNQNPHSSLEYSACPCRPVIRDINVPIMLQSVSRRLLLTGLGSAPFFGLSAAGFWEQKKYAEWSEKEV